jgi:hypothetical protein
MVMKAREESVKVPVAFIKNKAKDGDFKALIGLSPNFVVSAVTVSINLITSHVLWYSSREFCKARRLNHG